MEVLHNRGGMIWKLPGYERKDVLCKLQSTLLQTWDEGKYPAGDAFLWTENDPVSSGACWMASGVQCEGEEDVREQKQLFCVLFVNKLSWNCFTNLKSHNIIKQKVLLSGFVKNMSLIKSTVSIQEKRYQILFWSALETLRRCIYLGTCAAWSEWCNRPGDLFFLSISKEKVFWHSFCPAWSRFGRSFQWDDMKME